jgi:glycerophosphoryl diester phosphodiesterase
MTEDDPSLIPLLHGAGLSVMVWTADDVSQWRALVAAGAEGIITNRPDRLLGWLS